jgi:hypothetical protein
MVYLSKKDESAFRFHAEGVFVSCSCWGPSGNTLWIGNDIYVSIIEIDDGGNWLRNMYVGAGSSAIACNEISVVSCTECKDETWPKLIVLDYASGSIIATFGAFGLDAGLLLPSTTHVAIVGSYYVVAVASNSYMVRIDKDGNFAQIHLGDGGFITAICSAHNGRDVYVCTSKLPRDVCRIDIFTGLMQNSWSLPKDALGNVTDISCAETDKCVIVFSAETQILFTYR